MISSVCNLVLLEEGVEQAKAHLALDHHVALLRAGRGETGKNIISFICNSRVYYIISYHIISYIENGRKYYSFKLYYFSDGENALPCLSHIFIISYSILYYILLYIMDRKCIALVNMRSEVVNWSLPG
jgi:hypothetical protein